MNILLLYHETTTFTNTVFEHLAAFQKFSRNRFFFCHHDKHVPFGVDLSKFDAVMVHYCLRLPYNQVSEQAAEAIGAFRGLKFLFIQDEYDHPRRAWYWMKRFGFDLVFTVVPEQNIAQVYPPAEFPTTRFVSNLTGYVPADLDSLPPVVPPSQRKPLAGYRGRSLPLRYGQLGFEKVEVGRMVKAYCDANGLPCDIAWTEDARIYGPDWFKFIASCRAMLGSESGSNVFDWNDDLLDKIASYRAASPSATDREIYEAVVRPLEKDGLMNQISPRVFEAIALRTVLVLYEGDYSGVVRPDEHFIPLKKDGSNLDEVFRKLQDDAYVDAMTSRAWNDVIGSGLYGYPAFMAWVDEQVAVAFQAKQRDVLPTMAPPPLPLVEGSGLAVITTGPIRWAPPAVQPLSEAVQRVVVTPLRRFAMAAWSYTPEPMKPFLLPVVQRVLKPGWRIARRFLR